MYKSLNRTAVTNKASELAILQNIIRARVSGYILYNFIPFAKFPMVEAGCELVFPALISILLDIRCNLLACYTVHDNGKYLGSTWQRFMSKPPTVLYLFRGAQLNDELLRPEICISNNSLAFPYSV